MRAIFVLTVVLSALVGSGGAEPTEPPHARPPVLIGELQSVKAQPAVPLPAPIMPPSVFVSQGGLPTIAVPPPTAPPYGIPTQWPAHEFNHDQLQSLRHQLVALTGKRAERMTGPELQQSIVEMRRLNVISELKTLADESQEQFDGMRAEIAVMALRAKDRDELQTVIRSLAKELDKTKPATEQ